MEEFDEEEEEEDGEPESEDEDEDEDEDERGTAESNTADTRRKILGLHGGVAAPFDSQPCDHYLPPRSAPCPTNGPMTMAVRGREPVPEPIPITQPSIPAQRP